MMRKLATIYNRLIISLTLSLFLLFNTWQTTHALKQFLFAQQMQTISGQAQLCSVHAQKIGQNTLLVAKYTQPFEDTSIECKLQCQALQQSMLSTIPTIPMVFKVSNWLNALQHFYQPTFKLKQHDWLIWRLNLF